MNANYPTVKVTATPEYVLELLRDRCGAVDRRDDRIRSLLRFGKLRLD